MSVDKVRRARTERLVVYNGNEHPGHVLPAIGAQDPGLLRAAMGMYGSKSSLKLNSDQLQKVVEALNYHSGDAVLTALKKSAEWVRSSLGKRRYAVLVEETPDRMKSTHWLVVLLAEIVGRWPDHVIGVKPGKFNRGTRLHDIRQARGKGVTAFVYFDDASYSGTQIKEAVEAVADATYGSRRVLFLAAMGFLAKKARDVLKGLQHTTRASLDLRFHTGGVFRTMENVKRILGPELFHGLKGMSDAPTFSVLAHKTPNGLSMPRVASNILANYLEHSPIYHDMYHDEPFTHSYWAKSPNGRRVKYFVQEGTPYGVYEHDNNGVANGPGPFNVHEAFVNNKGHLKRTSSLDKYITRRPTTRVGSKRTRPVPLPRSDGAELKAMVEDLYRIATTRSRSSTSTPWHPWLRHEDIVRRARHPWRVVQDSSNGNGRAIFFEGHRYVMRVAWAYDMTLDVFDTATGKQVIYVPRHAPGDFLAVQASQDVPLSVFDTSKRMRESIDVRPLQPHKRLRRRLVLA